MSAVVTLPPGVQLCHLAARRLAGGGTLVGGQLAFERHGPADAPVVLVLGGISAGRQVAAGPGGAGWWAELVGPGLAIDTRRVAVLGVDWLGGVGCSTSPGAGEVFPALASADQADALAELLDRLRIARLAAVVGSSYGGMVGLQFAARHGARLQQLVAIAAAHRSHPLASAWRQIQRGIVQLGVGHGAGPAALALARQLAMTTYRSRAEFGTRFAGADAAVELAAWLAHHGERFAERWLPEQFLCLSASIDAHTVAPAAVATPTTLVSFDSDALVPGDDVRELAQALPRLVRHVELSSPYGHDAFLKEPQALGALLREVLS